LLFATADDDDDDDDGGKTSVTKERSRIYLPLYPKNLS